MEGFINKKIFICKLIGNRIDFIIENIKKLPEGSNEKYIASQIAKNTVFKDYTEMYKNLDCDRLKVYE